MMSDGWTNGKGRALLNLFVYCPKATMFIKTISTLAHVKDATLLCELLDEFIQEVGVRHVVQLVTYNIANYVVADKFLM
jgi:hypothetical protein